MSVKQFARFVEANQLLFSVDTRKKPQVANAFQGFKETLTGMSSLKTPRWWKIFKAHSEENPLIRVLSL